MILLLLGLSLARGTAEAQEARAADPIREATFEWDADLDVLFLSMGFREVIDWRAPIGQLKSGEAVVLHLERQGELMYLAFTLE